MIYGQFPSLLGPNASLLALHRWYTMMVRVVMPYFMSNIANLNLTFGLPTVTSILYRTRSFILKSKPPAMYELKIIISVGTFSAKAVNKLWPFSVVKPLKLDIWRHLSLDLISVFGHADQEGAHPLPLPTSASANHVSIIFPKLFCSLVTFFAFYSIWPTPVLQVSFHSSHFFTTKATK